VCAHGGLAGLLAGDAYFEVRRPGPGPPLHAVRPAVDAFARARGLAVQASAPRPRPPPASPLPLPALLQAPCPRHKQAPCQPHAMRHASAAWGRLVRLAGLCGVVGRPAYPAPQEPGRPCSPTPHARPTPVRRGSCCAGVEPAWAEESGRPSRRLAPELPGGDREVRSFRQKLFEGGREESQKPELGACFAFQGSPAQRGRCSAARPARSCRPRRPPRRRPCWPAAAAPCEVPRPPAGDTGAALPILVPHPPARPGGRGRGRVIPGEHESPRRARAYRAAPGPPGRPGPLPARTDPAQAAAAPCHSDSGWQAAAAGFTVVM
jgi:hypothetical protein